jgi:hypothetical protein
MRAADGLPVGFRKPEMLNLAFLDQVLDGSGYIFNRHGRIDAVLPVQRWSAAPA